MSKYKYKHHWNYRIVTKIFSYKKQFKKTNPKLALLPEERLFSIREVHYKNGKPVSYGVRSLMDDIETVKGLKWINKKIKIAFKKPILDADNWPHKFKK